MAPTNDGIPRPAPVSLLVVRVAFVENRSVAKTLVICLFVACGTACSGACAGACGFLARVLAQPLVGSLDPRLAVTGERDGRICQGSSVLDSGSSAGKLE